MPSKRSTWAPATAAFLFIPAAFAKKTSPEQKHGTPSSQEARFADRSLGGTGLLELGKTYGKKNMENLKRKRTKYPKGIETHIETAKALLHSLHRKIVGKIKRRVGQSCATEAASSPAISAHVS